MLSDAIVALATPPGRSALALIRLSGRGAFDVGARVLHPFHPDRPRVAVRVAVRHPTTGEDLDLGIATGDQRVRMMARMAPAPDRGPSHHLE